MVRLVIRVWEGGIIDILSDTEDGAQVLVLDENIQEEGVVFDLQGERVEAKPFLWEKLETDSVTVDMAFEKAEKEG